MRRFALVLTLLVVAAASAIVYPPHDMTYLVYNLGVAQDVLEAMFSTAGVFSGTLSAAGTATFEDTVAVSGGPFLIDASRPASTYAYAMSFDGTEFFSGGDAEKTYLLNLSGTRVAADTMSGDSRDRLIGGAYSNYAANDANSQVQGIGLNVRNRSGGTIATGKAAEFGYNNSSGGTTTNAYGATVTVENYGTLSTLLCGLLIDLRNEGAVATSEHGLWIRNTNNSIAGPVAEAIYVDDTGANTGWTYGISFEDAQVNTAEIIGQNAETISNVTDGYWDMGAPLVAGGYNFATAAMVTGSADSIVINFTPDLPTLAAGQCISFVAEASNTGAVNLYVDGGAAKAVYEASDISALDANDIRSGAVVTLVYDGTQWQQTSQSGN